MTALPADVPALHELVRGLESQLQVERALNAATTALLHRYAGQRLREDLATMPERRCVDPLPVDPCALAVLLAAFLQPPPRPG